MRPLNKGKTPTDEGGLEIAVTSYKQWRNHLIRRIGCYCAYCNQPLSNNLQVEHVRPKNPPAGVVPGAALEWDNMLLACGPCNLAKNNQPIEADTYYLPEEHNTHLPFHIITDPDSGHATVTERPGLNTTQHQKAHRTIKLLKLDNVDERPAIVDIRSIKRKAVMVSVESARRLYEMALTSPTYNAETVANDIATLAANTGFFSLWYEAFLHDPMVMKKLTDNSIIQGTASNCFDPDNGFQPIPRNPKNTIDPI